MSFQLKAVLGFAGVVIVALAAIFLLRNSDETAIQELLEEGAAAASRKDPEGVIRLLSRSYRNKDEDYDAVAARIREKISSSNTPPVVIAGAAIDPQGEEAVALVSIEPRLGPYKGEMLKLHLKLRKEEEGWRVTWAEWIR